MERLEHLKELQKRRAVLMDELERSLALRDLWPEVFAQGAARSVLITTSPGSGKIVAKSLKVTDGAGNSRTFPASEVPEILRGGLPC